MDLTGQTILHYQVLGQLGRGGMSLVYKARDKQLDRLVALKIPHLMTMSENEIVRFEIEARAAAALHHPNICTIFSLHKTPEFTFIAMEYVEGETLKSCIRRNGSFSVEQSVDIVIKLSQALAVAHSKGIIHRDVKSENVMITPDGSVKLMDFGLARLKEGPKLTRTGEVVGTAAYMSPEQAEGRPVDQRTDLWSLGVVFYEMLTGQLPFAGDSDVSTLQKILKSNPPAVRTFKKGIPKTVQYVLYTLLEKDIKYRYADAFSVIRDLRGVKRPVFNFFVRFVKKQMWRLTILTAFIGIFSAVVFYTIQQKRNIPPWLKPNAPMVRLTSESVFEHGSISPSGRYLAYVQGGLANLRIMNTSTLQNVLTDTSIYMPACPVWHPDESRIACVYGVKTIMDVPILWNEGKLGEARPVFKSDSCYIHQIAWSPDGQWISAMHFYPNTSSLWLHRGDRSEDRCLYTFRKTQAFIQSAWHPDSRHLSFYYYKKGSKGRSIRTIDILSGRISDDLVHVHYMQGNWIYSGMAVSPDGRFLVYPDSCQRAIELLALGISHNGMKSIGRTNQVTHFSGNGMPFWLYFTKSGRALSFLLGNPFQDIHIAPLDVKNKKISNALIPVCTDRKFNWDGNWGPDGNSVVFLSFQQNQVDMYLWIRKLRQIVRLTNTVEEEKRPQFLPDKPAISFIVGGVIYTMTVPNGKRTRIYPEEAQKKVHSYEWGKNSDTLYVVLTPDESGFDNQYPLRRVVLSRGKEEQIHTFRTTLDRFLEIRRSPTANVLAYRQIAMDRPDTLTIGLVNLKNGNCTEVAYQWAITPNGQLSWTPDGSSLFYRTNEPNEDVYGVFYLKSLSSPTAARLSIPERFDRTLPGLVSPRGDESLLMVEREEVDIWALGDLMK